MANSKRSGTVSLALFSLACATFLFAPSTFAAALLDVWRAEDLTTLNDGDLVGTWASASNHLASGNAGELPTFKLNATPAGGPVVRFSGAQRLSVVSSPVGGRTAFSLAVVFKASAPGASDAVQWYGKTGLVDAEEPGVTLDWGTVLTETGQVGLGVGNPDITVYSTGPSLVDTNYHAAVFTWGGGTQAVYLDLRARVSQNGASVSARDNAGISFGGIRTGELDRRLKGDLVEIRFYDAALSALEASNVVQELRDAAIFGKLPRVRSFTSDVNGIYLGATATLSWDVTNADSVVIDQGIGLVLAQGSLPVQPTTTTTYTLFATNTSGLRSAQVTVQVDPGIPIASNLATNTPRNAPVALTLPGFDPQGSNLTFSIVTPPLHGNLAGTPPNVVYTPALDYNGFDTFTFLVNDGTFDSAPGTVTIKVIPPPTPPSGIVLSTTRISAQAGPGAFLAALTAIDVNEGETHSFALVPGFGDNAQFTITDNLLNAGPAFAGGPGVTFNIRLRTTDSTGLSFEQNFLLTVVAVPLNVVINEINYNGPVNQVRDGFIELYNPGDAAVDLSQWRLAGGVAYFIPAGTTIPAHGFLVIAEDPPTLLTLSGVQALGPWSGGLNNDGEDITLQDALNHVVNEVNFTSEFPWPIEANGGGPTMQLVNPALDNSLGSSWRSGTPPTPGATNSVFAINAPPNIRQVQHTPAQPASTNQVMITCKVTDPEGVASVVLSYQVVAPGKYIPSFLPLTGAQLNANNFVPPIDNSPNPAFEAGSNWVTVAMTDDGLNGDTAAGDNIYTAVLPQQANRTLVRYRITVTDSLGASRRAPFEDDPSLNFAYYVYNGIPAYQGVSAAVLQTLPIYTLITRAVDLDQCAAWFAPFNNGTDQLPTSTDGRYHFNWEGTMVYDGQVYDHIVYRLRGANGRYHPGKRSMRFKFNDGRLLLAKDQFGHPFPVKWREIETGKGQSNRGSEAFGLNEVINYFLFNKVSVPAPFTFHFHFRVVRGASETGTGPYDGDFWGLNWVQEKYDVHFLDGHGLPKGNLYKLNDYKVDPDAEGRYFGPGGKLTGEDFYNIENNLTGYQPTDWLLAYVNYTNWYRFYAVCEAIRQYDFWPSANKNAAWFFEPIYTPQNNFLGRMMTFPYDTTDTWGPTWNAGQDVVHNGIFDDSSVSGGDAGQNPELQKQCRNTFREVRDLLFQPDQINAVIDAFAGPLYAFGPADMARWSNAPAPASYTSLFIPNSPGVTGGLRGVVQDMKNFMFVGGNNSWWIDRNSVGAGGWVTRLDQVAADGNVPTRPTATYLGTNGYPVDGLVFQSSAFSDPDGSNTFAAMRWRIAEVLQPGTTVTNQSQLKLEWDALWDSGELATFNDFITIPSWAVQADHTYRVRVRHEDSTGRWSQWSLPSEFRPGPRDLVSVLRTNLVFSEIMYDPPPNGPIDGDQNEFLELKNLGPVTLDLSGLFFSAGITFTFPNGTLLPPQGLFLLARNPTALAARYPSVIVNGTYTGKLNNNGETVTISHPTAGEIISVTYSAVAPWPVTAAGFGFSLVLADPATGTYRASADLLGTPGADGDPSPIGAVVINEILSNSPFPLTDMIELLNVAGTNIDISGWYLTDDPILPQKFRIPAGTVLGPGEFRVFTEADFDPTPGIGVSFGLSAFGDQVYLFSADSGAQLTGYSHGFSFGAAQEGVSLGRFLNSVGEEQLTPQLSRTFGEPNSGPRVGPVVISEIHYHPRTNADEFIELREIEGVDQPLFDPVNPTNTWKLSGAGFVFPTNITISANGFVLLVADDPAAFRARFSVAASVPIFQYAGNLQDNGENLELQAPDVPTTNGVPYYSVDQVRYNDHSPWPLAADGAGASLQRRSLAAFGNDPANWVAATPKPGTFGLFGKPPVISLQPVSITNTTQGAASFSVTAGGTTPLFYQWRFNGSNLDGATNSTLILSNLVLSSAGTYAAVVFNKSGSTASSNALLVVRVGPSVTNQPTNVLVRIKPDPAALPVTNATFAVGAVTYNPPLRFQWRFNGGDLLGATNSTLIVSNVQLSSEGSYSAAIIDSIGPAFTLPATLNTLISPAITVAPLSQSVVAGGTMTLSAAATGHPLPFLYQWRRAASILTNIMLNSTSCFFTVTNLAPADAGTYRLVVTNAASVGVPANVTFTVTILPDGDGDGLPDSWELQYFGATNAANASLDSDGDGLTNWEEYTAGTDPTNAASFLKVDLGSASGQPMVSFGAISNKTYTIQFTDRLPDGTWSKLADVLAYPSNRVEAIPDPAGNSNRFYRVITPRQQ